MPVAITKTRTKPERPTLSPEKGNELLGLLLLTLALLLGLALGTYHPGDPSLFHISASSSRARNLIGVAGAHVAAFGFQFLGLSSLLVPFFLLVAGWRRLRHRGAARVVGRGFGALLMLAALPPLFQLATGRIVWREGSVAAGGAFGTILADLLESRLNFAGSLLVLSAAVTIGGTLAVQSTLGDILAAWRARIARTWQDWTLARERRRERRAKERARRRVITKHLQRVVEEKQEKQRREDVKAPPPMTLHAADAVPVATAERGAGRLDLPMRPLRVTERKGDVDVALRRVRSAGPAEDDFEELDERPSPPASPAAARPSRPARPSGPAPQKQLPFAGEAMVGALPPVNLLQMSDERAHVDEDELVRSGEAIRSRCAEFGVEGTVAGISPGPVITVYEFQPAPGVKVSQIVNLQDDLALALKAESVRIDRMAGRSTLGIEVPNRQRAVIRLGNLLADERFRKSPSVLTLALGTNIHGEPYYADLATMPHLLVAGATGAGKSVGLQGMITSILYKATREEVQFIFIDPKRIELGVYADIPHLKAEVVVDPKKAANALRWAVAEMERRYRLLAEVHVRSIAYYNRAIEDPQVQERL
ncbi:MAG TPA: DNA translocase FtsK 4TM domain-containing protein, partial [Thermoanaerobaculia bacterium]|nr:DNA translocase FtsK 4TM domain-containing protein [Thermoanaerobaculia bacterium]